MFSCFKLNIIEDNYDYFVDKYFDIGDKYLDTQKTLVYKELDNYIDKTDNPGAIDGSKLQEDWFKKIDLDVFISHSHSDEKLAISIAGWLHKEFDLSSFVDSRIWGYANDLLDKMNRRYNVINQTTTNTTFSYEGCNTAASHVHMMLCTSINKMIDRCECVFFLNTPNSLVTYNNAEKTKSPWIYAEICLANTIRRKIPERAHNYLLREDKTIKHYFASEMIIEYKVDFTEFIDLSSKDLMEWYNNKRILNHSLDSLYKIKKMLK